MNYSHFVMIVFVIGLSGVYNVMDHYKHEKMRAVEYVSTMHKAMGGVENFDYYSPTSLLKKFNEDQLKRYDIHIIAYLNTAQKHYWCIVYLS